MADLLETLKLMPMTCTSVQRTMQQNVGWTLQSSISCSASSEPNTFVSEVITLSSVDNSVRLEMTITLPPLLGMYEVGKQYLMPQQRVYEAQVVG